MVTLIFALILATPQPTLKDDGFGLCPSFSHYHPTVQEFTLATGEERGSLADEAGKLDGIMLDGKCHADDDDRVIIDAPRKVLPKPKPNQRWKWL